MLKAKHWYSSVVACRLLSASHCCVGDLVLGRAVTSESSSLTINKGLEFHSRPIFFVGAEGVEPPMLPL